MVGLYLWAINVAGSKGFSLCLSLPLRRGCKFVTRLLVAARAKLRTLYSCASHEPTGITGVVGPSFNNDKIRRIVVFPAY